ncbi:hypothetical protein [uncultured Azonexus sp.]|uniref:hypothetical protein n=1 Tax=uncultured Azonexus sp. TaxID=520307 RepID=UPI0026249AE0|nr:hypothetical protein [uncultured Azonexus sp.]
MNDANRIKYALYLREWEFHGGDKAYLRRTADNVPPLDYSADMKGHLFCPECCAPLFRSPEGRDYAADGRRAFYAHTRGVDTECSLRVKQAEGKRYENEEEARQAIEDGELVLIQSFMTEKPVPPEVDGPGVYDREPNEDINGLPTLVAIGRHRGEVFNLPRRITTVRGLCRRFEENLYKYFLLPEQQVARTLEDQLIDVRDVSEACDVPRLYFGRIVHSKNMGHGPQNIRMTFLEYPGKEGQKDFCLKATDASSRDHGIDDDSVHRIVIMYGRVTESGIGLCISRLGWGEFALLPERYDYLFEER